MHLALQIMATIYLLSNLLPFSALGMTNGSWVLVSIGMNVTLVAIWWR